MEINGASGGKFPVSRKEEILRAAEKLFSRKGYEAASMRDLADELRLKPPSLYSHYPSKEDILWEIAIRCAQEFHARMLPLAADESRNPDARLAAMVHMHIELIIENVDAAAIFFKEWRRLEEPKRSQYAEMIQIYEGAFTQVLRQGIETGLFRPVTPTFTTLMLLNTANWIHRWYYPGGSMSLADISEECTAFILAGLRP
ncbi:MAG: TetR/AcrR family transcriptional regulator [Bacteroidia bacterium]|nr:TetR/AcrR family transcriptional regulator [Bacteroidia bacterium]